MSIFSSTNSAKSDSWYPDTEERVKNKMARPSFKKSDFDEKLIIKTGIQATGNEHEEREMKNGNKTENGIGWMRIRMGLPIEPRAKLGFVAIF